MDQPSRQGRTGLRQLPILYVDGEHYFVDQRLREFRKVTGTAIAFIPFDSERGREFLQEIVAIPCDLCGARQLQPRRAIPSNVLCFDCAGR